MTVLVIGSMRFPPQNIARVLPHLRRLCEETRRLDGCIAYDVAEDIFAPGLLRFSEIWPDAESLAAHLSAPHIAPWRAVAQANGVHDRSFTAYDGLDPRPV